MCTFCKPELCFLQISPAAHLRGEVSDPWHHRMKVRVAHPSLRKPVQRHQVREVADVSVHPRTLELFQRGWVSCEEKKEKVSDSFDYILCQR